MQIIDFADNIVNNDILLNANLKYCFVDAIKRPFKYNGESACPNKIEDFVSFDQLIQSDQILNFAGIGISIQASNICAIDVDRCFSIPFDILSANEKAKDIINLFSQSAYIEFSFSGTGLRILFRKDVIENYEADFYIKNSKEGIEYYQPGKSFRYVTITGKTIKNNSICNSNSLNYSIDLFLNKYMKRQKFKIESNISIEKDNRSIEELFVLVKKLYLKNFDFQNLWFSNAPGSGKDESERDYRLVVFLYSNVTCDIKKIKELFEMSPFFKTKDYKHKMKWTRNNNRYFYYLCEKIKGN